MPLEGDLTLFRLPDVLQVIAQQHRTGILTVQGKSDILAISFLEGEIVAADALNQSFDELLGEVLERRASIGRERFAELVEHQRSSGERLIDHVVAAGVVGREEVLEALRELTYRLLVDVLRWREGQFKFYGGEEVAFEEGIRPLRVDEVLMRSLRERSREPEQAARIPHGYLAYRSRAEGRAVRVIPDDADESIVLDSETHWLTPDEWTILDRLDGRTPADQLARESGFGEARTFYAIYRLLQSGLAVPISEKGEPMAPVEPVRRPPSPRPAARTPELRVERSLLEAADLEPAAPHPLAVALRQGAPAIALLVALALAVGLWIGPETVLFAPAGTAVARADYERLLRLERLGLIDRAARTFHLLEGRYPVGIDELVTRGLLPASATRMTVAAPIVLRSEVDTYQVVIGADSPESPTRLREGVYGDFLLDHSLFVDLEEETGVPLVLVD